MRLTEKNDNKLQLDFKDHEPAIAKMRKASALLSVNFEKFAIESDFKLWQKCKKYEPLDIEGKIYHNSSYKIKHLKKKTGFDLNKSHRFSDKRLESIFLKWNQILKDGTIKKFQNLLKTRLQNIHRKNIPFSLLR